MKILVIGRFYTDSFGLHIAETLAAMGHTVRRFEPGMKYSKIGGSLGHRLDQVRGGIYSAMGNLPAVRAFRMRALWQVLDEEPVDLVLVCHDFLWPEEVSELKRRTKAKVAMWYPDAIVQFGRGFFMNAPYDGLFFKDPYIIHALGDALKSPVYYMPECFNPQQHWLSEESVGKDPAYQCDITTAGNYHSWRVAVYKNLQGYNVKLWGKPAPLWMAPGPIAGMHQGRAVYNHEKVRAFRGAKIVINNLHLGEIWGVNARCFEAAGAGSFQMMDWRPGVAQLFEDGREVVTFTSIADLKDKVNFWLPRDAERRAIAAAGMRRAHKDHTYELRLDLILATLAGAQKGYPMPEIRYEA